jgi:hypothetical protein
VDIAKAEQRRQDEVGEDNRAGQEEGHEEGMREGGRVMQGDEETKRRR